MQTELVGLAAAFLTTLAFLPQVLHTIRTRSTHDISLRMYSLFTLGVFLWLIYGLILRDVPIIGANAVTLLLSGTVLVLKLRHG
ncbi:MAG: SemiSWEET family sugar transporter [Proteobacteria bacterium]|nr:SemiSWEET family sugar transporter [Pseudomonadota bacterium]